MNHLHLLVIILALVGKSFQSTEDNEVNVDEGNPLADIVASIINEQNSKEIGGALLQSLLQSNTANALGQIFSKLGERNPGEILDGLVQVLGKRADPNKLKNGKPEVDVLTVLKNLGGLMDTVKSTFKSDDSAALLQGLGSLMGASQGEGGLDLNLVGSLINMFSQTQGPDTPTKRKDKPTSKTSGKSEDSFDISNMLSLVSTFMGQGGGDSAGSGLSKLLPMIVQTVQSFTGPEAKKRADQHSEHSSQLPPVLEKVHVAFDHFIHSEIGKQLISSIGAEKAFNYFRTEKGTFDYQKFSEKMENMSFRRQWIKVIVDKLIGYLQYLSQPQVYKEYFSTAQLIVNSYLRAQGFPKSTLFDPKNPTETLSSLANYVAKKYFDIKIKSKEYVQPTIEYLQEILRLLEKQGPLSNEYKEIASKLADTINMEIIEPLVRVNRAYRYAKSVPSCTRYILCLVNQDNDDKEVESIQGLKKSLTKAASFVAGWYLSTPTDISFWTLYSDIMDAPNCKSLYRQQCDGFHEEELKATTEYVHTEL